MAQLLPLPKLKFFDDNGVPLSGGSLYSYQAGTSTPLATYTDESEGTPNTNPIVLDANGECSAWIGSSSYRFILQDSLGTTIWTVDNVQSVNDLSITTAKITDSAVTTAKIADSAVTTAKIQDLAVTTAKLAAKSVTAAKIADATITAAQVADGAISTAELADGGITVAKLNSAFSNGFNIGRNRIINGCGLVRTRPAVFGSLSTGDFLTDRWRYEFSGSMAHQGTNGSDVPSVASAGRFYQSSLELTLVTAQASIGSTDFTILGQKIEGYGFTALAQRNMMLSFWVKATKVGKYCVSLRNSGKDRSYVAEYTVNTTATWEYKTISVPASPSGGTWNYLTGIGIDVCFTLAAGSTYQTTAGSWQSGNYLATANQINGVDSSATSFEITAVQLESGTYATDFDERGYIQELGLCQRYHQAVNGEFVAFASGGHTSCIGGSLPFFMQMRALPTAAILSSTLVNTANITASSISQYSVLVLGDFVAAGTASIIATVGVDAEL